MPSAFAAWFDRLRNCVEGTHGTLDPESNPRNIYTGNESRSCLIYDFAASANDLKPALIAGLAPDVSSDFECMRQLPAILTFKEKLRVRIGI
jgi:hypothetical protein